MAQNGSQKLLLSASSLDSAFSPQRMVARKLRVGGHDEGMLHGRRSLDDEIITLSERI